ncbi:MAG: amidohydrolase family protein [Melioribacteraceae bacterium]|nr:amidohydrolase family protein [Melioribacteraceae bacterium]
MQKVIKNVLISTRFNKLQLVDIYFDERITSVEPAFNKEIDWLEIENKEQFDLFISQVESKNYSESIQVFDGGFKLAIPGAIDAHVHFNTPGFEFRDEFEYASKSAAVGGTTTIFDMPCTSIPPVTSKENFSIKQKALSGKAFIDYKFWGGISGNDFEEINKLKKQVKELCESGVAGFKVYTISGMQSFTDLTYEQIKIAAQVVKENNSILAVHAEDKKLVTDREKSARMNLKSDWGAYCGARDDQAEAKAVFNVINIAAETGCHIHIVHLSSALGLGLIRKAQKQGVRVTTETCPHYLQFTQIDFDDPKITKLLKTAPPVKFETDRDALWNGLKDGTISFVTTDHAGCDPLKEKISDDFWEVYGGIPGVQHRVNYMLSEGFFKGKIDLQTTVHLLSAGVAEIFGLTDKGTILKGFDADITLVDLYKNQKINSKEMLCKGKYTPFNGIELKSSISEVFLRGRKIVDRGKIYSPDYHGNLLTK